MRILAISGSIRPDSYNTALLRAAAKLAPQGMHVTLYDGLHDLPVFVPDADDNNMPGAVKSFLSRVKKADGVIIGTPEYAHGLSGVLKNALDWFVASDAFVLKPVVATSVSTSALGGARGNIALLLTLSAMNAQVVTDGSLTVPFAKRRFGDDGELVDEITRDAVKVSLAALARAINENSA